MFVYHFKNFIRLVVTLLFCIVAASGVRLANVTRFSDIAGERTFFLDSTSSQGLRRESLSFAEVGRVRGECVKVSLSQYEGGRDALNADDVAKLVGQYRAEILFTEEVCGVVSYYCYTPMWGDGVYLYGQKINLHIAIGEEMLVLGSPMIFDGF